jgi:hypothetical protein
MNINISKEEVIRLVTELNKKLEAANLTPQQLEEAVNNLNKVYVMGSNNIRERLKANNLIMLDEENGKLGYHDGDNHTGFIFNTEQEIAESLALKLNKTVPQILGYLKQNKIYLG